MAVIAQLAIKGKRPRDTGGYRLLGHSLGELDRADFNRIFASLDVGQPNDTSGADTPLPWLIFGAYRRSPGGQLYAVAISQEWLDYGEGGSGRGLFGSFCLSLPWEDYQRTGPSFARLAQLIPAEDCRALIRREGARDDEPLPSPQLDSGAATPGEAWLERLAGQIDGGNADQYATAAALLAAGQRLGLVWGPRLSSDDRLLHLDAILALLPGGMRRRVSASTWISASTRSAVGLGFTGPGAMERVEVPAAPSQMVYGQQLGARQYAEKLRLLRPGVTTARILAHLAGETVPDDGPTIDDCLASLDRLIAKATTEKTAAPAEKPRGGSIRTPADNRQRAPADGETRLLRQVERTTPPTPDTPLDVFRRWIDELTPETTSRLKTRTPEEVAAGFAAALAEDRTRLRSLLDGRRVGAYTLAMYLARAGQVEAARRLLSLAREASGADRAALDSLDVLEVGLGLREGATAPEGFSELDRHSRRLVEAVVDAMLERGDGPAIRDLAPSLVAWLTQTVSLLDKSAALADWGARLRRLPAAAVPLRDRARLDAAVLLASADVAPPFLAASLVDPKASFNQYATELLVEIAAPQTRDEGSGGTRRRGAGWRETQGNGPVERLVQHLYSRQLPRTTPARVIALMGKLRERQPSGATLDWLRQIALQLIQDDPSVVLTAAWKDGEWDEELIAGGLGGAYRKMILVGRLKELRPGSGVKVSADRVSAAKEEELIDLCVYLMQHQPEESLVTILTVLSDQSYPSEVEGLARLHALFLAKLSKRRELATRLDQELIAGVTSGRYWPALQNGYTRFRAKEEAEQIEAAIDRLSLYAGELVGQERTRLRTLGKRLVEESKTPAGRPESPLKDLSRKLTGMVGGSEG